MEKRLCLLAVVVLLVLSVSASPARPAYPRNGAALGSDMDDHYNPVLIASGPGGAIVAWGEYRNGEFDIFAKRIGSDGTLLWQEGGVAICAATGDQLYPQMVPDGEGGAIIVWMDQRMPGTRLYAQRVDSTGAVLWDADGVNVCTVAGGGQMDARLIPYEGGGAIITWSDARNGDNNYDIFAQRIDEDGAGVWEINGIEVCTAASNQYIPDIISDGAGGVIIVWEDYRAAEWDIYAQRIDPDGDILWATNGAAVCTEMENQISPRLASDMAGGAIITWNDYRHSTMASVYAQRILTDGYESWTPGGIWVALGWEWENLNPQIVSDGTGGAIIAYADARPGGVGIYAKRIGGLGTWGDQAVPLCVAPVDFEELSLVSDGEGGAIAAWMDYRNGSGDVYAQRIDADGSLLWSPNGTAICTALNAQKHVQAVSDESGSAVIAWEDYRWNRSWAYVQRVHADGLWGNPEPRIADCLDVPGDQGGLIRIKVLASSHDVKFERDYPIEGYNVWRRMGFSGGGPLSFSAKGAPSTDFRECSRLMADCRKMVGMRLNCRQALALGFPEGEWESVGFHAATRDTTYYLLAPTRNDSTASGAPKDVYLVTAHTTTPGVFAVSNPDSGYSVDDLAPGVTAGFAGIQSLAPPGLRLSWKRNNAPDLMSYDVYRGDNAAFVPDDSSFLGATDDTVFYDGGWVHAYFYFYKLVAVDRHGNGSPAALLRPEDVKVGTLLASFAASYSRGGIDVTWRLSQSPTGKRFIVLRAAGEAGAFVDMPNAGITGDGMSFAYHDGSVEPGGIYRYRVDMSEETGSMTLFETQSIAAPAMPLTLHQNHPNPLNPSTRIEYYLPEKCLAGLEIYDISGKRIANLVGREQERGSYAVEWNGKDAQGNSVGSGIYFYRLTAGKETISRKMVVLR